MAVKIRMTRMGRRHRPFFRINRSKAGRLVTAVSSKSLGIMTRSKRTATSSMC
jgi:ribosomal protein S16